MIKSIVSKYSNMSLPVKMAFWFLICSFIQKGIGMITTPIFTRIMIDSEYGRFGLYSSWYSIIAAIVTLSISGNCFTRGLIVLDDEKKRKELASSLLGLVTTLIISFCILYAIFHNQINRITGLSGYLIAMMMIDLLLVTACQFWTNSKRVDYKYREIVVITLSYAILRPIIAVIAVLSVPEASQVEARVTGIAIANAVLFTWIFVFIFIKGKHFYIRENWKYALAFCLPLIPHYLSKTILNESDRIMISLFCGNADVGYYSVAYTIAAIMTIFNSAVAQSLDPWLYRSIKTKSLRRIGPVSYKITAIIALINFMVMAIAPEALYILAPPSYHQALWVIPPVTASVFFTFMYDLFASFQFYFKKTNWIAIGSCVGAILNIALNAIFIPKYGFIAAGYTTLVCYILFGILHYVFMRKVCKLFLDDYRIYDWKIIFGIGAVLVLGSFIMTILYTHTVIRYTVLMIFIIVLFLFRKTIMDLFKTVKQE